MLLLFLFIGFLAAGRAFEGLLSVEFRSAVALRVCFVTT